jgi:predicted MFS family arabinose efflux permease
MPAALRKLLMAQVPADFADWLDFVAIGALLAYVWQVDPFVFAVLAVSFGLPYLLVGPFAGVAVDRANINRILIISNLGRAVMTAALFFAPNWGILVVFIALRGVVDTFYTPAKQAAIQALTEPDGRMRANGLSHAINQASKIVAPALGGTLLIWLTPQSVFLLNALVSVVAALMLIRLPRVPRATSDDTTQGSMLQNLRAGLTEVNTNPILRPALFMMGAGYFAMFFYDTLIAPLTRDLGFSQTILGMSLAAVGAGGVLGALILGTKETKIAPFVIIVAGSALAGIMVMALGIFEVAAIGVSTFGFIAIFAVLGLCSAMAVVPFRTIIQNSVSADRIGRVTALSEAINTIALLTAPFIGAALASFFSIGAAFICGGGVMLVVALRAWFLRHYR